MSDLLRQTCVDAKYTHAALFTPVTMNRKHVNYPTSLSSVFWTEQNTSFCCVFYRSSGCLSDVVRGLSSLSTVFLWPNNHLIAWWRVWLCEGFVFVGVQTQCTFIESHELINPNTKPMCSPQNPPHTERKRHWHWHRSTLHATTHTHTLVNMTRAT